MFVFLRASLWRPQHVRKAGSRLFSKSQREIEIQVPNSPSIRLSIGKLARFADGSSVATVGKTSVLTTAVSKARSSLAGSAGVGFFPLTVDYRQKAAAAGRIPTNYLRRELGPSEKEILTSRIIDRSIRPLFPMGFAMETQVVCNLLAVDGFNDPDVIAINAASAALTSSDIPWNGPVGAVRVACVADQFIVNPTRKEMACSSLNLVVTGSFKGEVIMIEAEANNLDKVRFLEALKCGLESSSVIAKEIQSAFPTVEKRPFSAQTVLPTGIYKDMELMCAQKIRGVFHDVGHDKVSRDTAIFAIRDDAIVSLRTGYQDLDQSIFYECYGKVCRDVVADMVLQEKRRVDGRTLNELRPISCEVNLHAPLHGSSVFQRGQTQVFCTVALDSAESALKLDPISVLTGSLKEKNFFLHYEFPAYATNDIGRSGVGRRELGHGALAEKALKAVIPKDYPFTIRLTSEVLESNGSSSMASVCGGSLALLDAGVPISESAAGVAVGLVSKESENGVREFATMLDILGLEDFLGDMDFKVAGTRSGITGLQADIKLPGLPFKVVEEALEKGHDGICRILDIMADCIDTPRMDKANLPVTESLEIPSHKRRKFVGPGGVNLRKITSETGVQANQMEDNAWSLFAPNREAMDEAKVLIDSLLRDDASIPEFEFGAIVPVKILDVKERGATVELHPGLEPAFIHVSQLSASKVQDARVLDLEVGKTLQVKYFGRDAVTGAMRLSRKALTVANVGAVQYLKRAMRRESE